MVAANSLNISETGFQSFDGVSVFHGRTLTGGSNISITNGTGVSGNPIISATGLLTSVQTANATPQFQLSGTTETLDFGLTNLLLGDPGSHITSAIFNVGIGLRALSALSSGSSSVAVGYQSLINCSTGGSNTAIGGSTLGSLVSGNDNTVIGQSAGSQYSSSESSNILIKNIGTTAESNTIKIGTQGSGSGQQNKCFVAGIVGVTTSNTQTVTINSSTGQLGAQSNASTLNTTFTSSGSWTINPRTVSVEIYAWGGGGGGGSGRCGVSGTSGGGSGASPGFYVYSKFVASQVTASPYTVTIGDGGAGGVSVNAVTTNGNTGTPGNQTSVGALCVAPGGAGGLPGLVGSSGGPTGSVGKNGFSTLTVSGLGGAAGTPITSSGVYSFAQGGGGGGGYTLSTLTNGGVGGSITDAAGNTIVAGGTAGTGTADGGTGGSGFSVFTGGGGGGGGGSSATGVASAGGVGGLPGGGGGGGGGTLSSTPSGTGGVGGKGMVIIIEYF